MEAQFGSIQQKAMERREGSEEQQSKGGWREGGRGGAGGRQREQIWTKWRQTSGCTVNRESDVHESTRQEGRNQSVVPQQETWTLVAKGSSTFVCLIKQTLSVHSVWMQILLRGKPTQFRAPSFSQIELSKAWAYSQKFSRHTTKQTRTQDPTK